MRRQIILFILTATLACNAGATGQYPDILLVEGDTLLLYPSPLETYIRKLYSNTREIPGFREYYKDRQTYTFSSALHRKYIATWEISDGKLYLTEVRGGDGVIMGEREIAYADLQAMFGDKYLNGRVLAEWVNNYLYIGKGKTVYYGLYLHIGEIEVEIALTQGVVTSFREYKTLQNNDSPDAILITNSEGRVVFDINPIVRPRLVKIINDNFNWEAIESAEVVRIKLFYFIDDDWNNYVLTESGYRHRLDRSRTQHLNRLSDKSVDIEGSLSLNTTSSEETTEEIEKIISKEEKELGDYFLQVSAILKDVKVETLIYEGIPFDWHRFYELDMLFDPQKRSVRLRHLRAE